MLTKGKLFDILKHPIIVALIGTGLVSIAGIYLTNHHQNLSWEKEKRYEIFREQFDGGVHLIDALSELMNERVFGMYRSYWAINDGDLKEYEAVWNEYYESVKRWNIELMNYKNRIYRYVGEAKANEFEDREDAKKSYAGNPPQTVNGHFIYTHWALKKYISCKKQSCASDVLLKNEKTLLAALRNLSDTIYRFTREITEEIYSSANYFE